MELFVRAGMLLGAVRAKTRRPTARVHLGINIKLSWIRR